VIGESKPHASRPVAKIRRKSWESQGWIKPP